MDKTERVSSSKSLVCLLQALQGRSAVIELRNEITIQGGVYKVDHCMNTTLLNASSTKLNGECQHFQQLFIHGTQIRYVQIPDDMDVMATITKQVEDLLNPSVHKQGEYKRQRMRRAKLELDKQHRREARQLKLGRGRALTTTTN